MSIKFRREYLVRIPLPLAQLYSRAYNAKDARAQHDNSFYLLEALIKLAASVLVASYRRDASRTGNRVQRLDNLTAQLALPSLGQWVGLLREISRHFGSLPDASSHPMGHLWQQLSQKRRDLKHLLNLYRQTKNGADGQAATDQTFTVMQVLEALVQYRNGVFGHGASRFDEFYENEMGPLLFPAINELLSDGLFEYLGSNGSRLVYITEIRKTSESGVELAMRELVGLQGERMAPASLTADEAKHLTPNCVAVLWPGHSVPLRLDPLLQYRENELSDELLFLNRDRNGRQVEYLSYTTGRTERDKAMSPLMAAFLSEVTGRDITEQSLEQLAEQSIAATPSFEGFLASDNSKQRLLGDYEILAEIGRGGMGVVYLARQMSLGRTVALKMLPADLAADEVALARFRREMRALSRCDHPNIVKVLASGTMPDGQMFYTMEYVQGCDVEQFWRELSSSPSGRTEQEMMSWSGALRTASAKNRRGLLTRFGNSKRGTPADSSQQPIEGDIPELPLQPIPELPEVENQVDAYQRHIANLIKDAARALQTVHAQNIIHRDVKPANLLLNADGSRIVLMDFGLAKGDAQSMTATRAGGFLGTLRYSAPEQLAAATLSVGPQADVRALGVTLWELLTRCRLFEEAEDEKQLAMWVHERDVPLVRTIDPSLDPDLEAITARATERRTADRIQSADQLADYLQMYLDGESLPIRPPSSAELMRRWIREHKGLVASVATAAAVILISVVTAFILINSARSDAVLARNDAIEEKEKAENLATANRLLADQERDAKEEAERNFGQAQRAVDDFLTRVSKDELGDIPGSQPLRKKLLEKSVNYYLDFLRTRTDDTSLQAKTADTYYRIANVASEVASKNEALDAFSEAIRRQTELVSNHPDDTGYAISLAETRWAMGNAYQDAKEWGLALGQFKKAAEIIGEKIEDDPDNIQLNLLLGRYLAAQGDPLSMQQKYVEGRAICSDARPYIELAYTKENDPDAVLAICTLESIEGQNWMSGPGLDRVKSVALLNTSINRLDVLAVAYPTKREIRFMQAKTLWRLGEAHRMMQDSEIGSDGPAGKSAQRKASHFSNAESAYRKSAEIGNTLWRTNPAVERYGRLVLDSKWGLARFYDQNNLHNQAISAYQDALRTIEPLVKDSREPDRYRRVICLICNSMAGLQNQLERTEQVAVTADKFVEAADSLHQSHPNELTYANYLIVALRIRGDAAEGLNKMNEAIEYHRRATQIFPPLLASLKDGQQKANFTYFYDQALDRVAKALAKSGDLASAIKYMETSLELAESQPELSNDFELALSARYNTLGEAYLEDGQLKKAKALFEKNLEFIEPRGIARPYHFFISKRWHRAWSGLGQVHMAQENYEEARKCFEKSIEIGEDAFAYEGLAELHEKELSGLKNDPALIQNYRKKKSVKKFTVPCRHVETGETQKYDVYIWTPKPDVTNPLEGQARTALEDYKLEIPEDVQESFIKLLALARENNVSFPELCVFGAPG